MKQFQSRFTHILLQETIDFLDFHKRPVAQAIADGENGMIFNNLGAFLNQVITSHLKEVRYRPGKSPEMVGRNGINLSEFEKLGFGLAGVVVHLISRRREDFLKGVACGFNDGLKSEIHKELADLLESDIDKLEFLDGSS